MKSDSIQENEDSWLKIEKFIGLTFKMSEWCINREIMD